MRIPIFRLKSTTGYKNEYDKMMKVLNSKCIEFDKKNYTYFDFINTHLFHNWKYRGTYLDCIEYLEFIGINLKSKKITEEGFINFLEFILNIQQLTNSLSYYSNNTKYSIACKSILVHNIPLILDSMNLEAYSMDDKVMILEKNIEYKELLNLLPNDIEECILSYSSSNNNGIKIKRLLLYKIYQYMEKNLDQYKSYNSSLVTQIKNIIMKMGVIGEVDKKYKDLTNYKLKKYYDICFQYMNYLFYTEKILKYKEEVKKDL